MINVLISICTILMYICLPLACYYAVLYIIGLFSHKQRYKMVEDKLKFCIFVPCHDEASVIGATIENYRQIIYNKDLFDIYFIADNCSDNTADVIHKSISLTNNDGTENFYLFERNVTDPNKKGKPHAIRWAIDLLEKEDSFYSKYDMFMMLDADNFVDPDILTHINSQYLSYKESNRPCMIQAYVDSKNNNNIISRGYFVSYRISNGFFQLPKHKLGMVPTICGTGFAIETKFLKDIGGYNCKSITEDVEIQTIATLNCRKVVYNGNVRVYDEKPTGIKQSIVQRTRWAQGHWYNFFVYLFPLLISLFNFKQIRFFFKKVDILLYLSIKLVTLLIAISISIFMCLLIAGISVPLPLPIIIINICLLAIGILIIPVSSLYDGKLEEKKKVLLHFIPNILSVIYISIINTYSSFVGLLKCANQKTWKKTAHKVNKMQ